MRPIVVRNDLALAARNPIKGDCAPEVDPGK